MPRNWNGEQPIVDANRLASREDLVRAACRATIGFVDPDMRVEVRGVATGIGNIILVGQQNGGEASPGLERSHDRLRPAWRIHHDVAARSTDQERVRTPGRPGVVAEAVDALCHLFRKDTVRRTRMAFGPNGSGWAEQARPPCHHQLFLGFRLPRKHGLTATFDDQPRCDRARGRAVDAVGIDVPLTGSVQYMSLSRHRRPRLPTPTSVYSALAESLLVLNLVPSHRPSPASASIVLVLYTRRLG